MAVTLEQVKALRVGDVLLHAVATNADGSPRRWRVNGKVRTWKRDPLRVMVPLKHGLYAFGYLTGADLQDWFLESEF